jgi:hypothetical protein
VTCLDCEREFAWDETFLMGHACAYVSPYLEDETLISDGYAEGYISPFCRIAELLDVLYKRIAKVDPGFTSVDDGMVEMNLVHHEIDSIREACIADTKARKVAWEHEP